MMEMAIMNREIIKTESSVTEVEIYSNLVELLYNFDDQIDIRKINKDASLTEIGLDSMDVLEFVMEVEEMYEILLPINQASVVKNVEGLVKLVQITLDKKQR